ncbi:GntR family transcriptional regulator [Roseibium marinum]|uniref:DNA-binding GntR family transcriptional regulator n=1 Tax=Roseibium marinum TaxID=281252 RepID=A0A2S3UP25_9HYPH|nr:GntR family transcriptional regulator [Roseibium marinum]POF29424.1 DNA-binding GntR family transcriptional regulator [Roseibium marinum]
MNETWIQDPDIAGQLEAAATAQERFQIMYTVLRDRISMLVYPPGMQLSEEVLAGEFGVSRSPLRKALQILEADGLVLSQQGVGTLVTDVDLDELAQVYQLRMELNELTGRLSPSRADDNLKALFGTMRLRAESLRAAPDRQAFARLNIDFFHSFQLLTDNQPLRDISEKLFYRTCRIWLTLIPDRDLSTEVVIFSDEILAIADAVAVGDMGAAAHIRRAHLSMGLKRLTEMRKAECPQAG